LSLSYFHLIAGAFIFQAIEIFEYERRKEEKPHKFYEKNLTMDCLSQIWDITSTNISFMDDIIYRERVNEILLEYQRGVVRRQIINQDVEKQWSFSGAFLYSLTVITTIGSYAFYTLTDRSYELPFAFSRIWQYFTKIRLGQIGNNFICNYWHAFISFVFIKYRRCSGQVIQMDLFEVMLMSNLSGRSSTTYLKGKKETQTIGHDKSCKYFANSKNLKKIINFSCVYSYTIWKVAVQRLQVRPHPMKVRAVKKQKLRVNWISLSRPSMMLWTRILSWRWVAVLMRLLYQSPFVL